MPAAPAMYSAAPAMPTMDRPRLLKRLTVGPVLMPSVSAAQYASAAA